MAYLWHFGCIIDRHKPVRHTVVWDGYAYSGTCCHCGAAITRQKRRDWRKQTIAAKIPRRAAQEQPV